MIMLRWLCFILLISPAVAADPVRSGHASATWLAGSAKVEPGAMLKTVVRLSVDPEWHVYWVNPGDAGIPTNAEFKLPDAWSAGVMQHPLPGRFLTGELHGFGHGGVVDYAVGIKVPNDFDGNAVLKAEVSWLTCNNEACVPGDAAVELVVADGKIAAGSVDELAVKQAFAKLPVAAPDGYRVQLENEDEHWKLVIKDEKALGIDLAGASLWVETPEVVAASAEVKLLKTGDRWVAEFPKSPYAPKKLAVFSVLLVSGAGDQSVRLLWDAPKKP